jgi:hypothetical protein
MFKIGDKVKLSKLHTFHEEYKHQFWIVDKILFDERIVLLSPISGFRGGGISKEFLELVKDKSHLPKWW